jgi:hypothetical protein
MKYLIIALLLSVGAAESFAQGTWRLAKDEKGIKVYVGDVPNSDYHAFRAVMTVKTTEREVLNVLGDVNTYPEWFAFTASAKLLQRTEQEQSFFMETDYPWPFANECMNYSMTFQRMENKAMKITIMGTNDKVNCAYSLKKASGYILLETESGGTTITYYFHSEPSQKIPPPLINPMIYMMPFQTFVALQKKLLP